MLECESAGVVFPIVASTRLLFPCKLGLAICRTAPAKTVSLNKMLPSGVLEGACPVLASFRNSCCGLNSRHVFELQLCRPVVRLARKSEYHHAGPVRAVISEPSASDNAGDSSAADFVKRAERAWMISKQPHPLKCASCEASGSKECVWCKGTGFFILGDSMLCEVPSRNTACVICAGQGVVPCKDCKGTGFRAQWLGPPPKEDHEPDHGTDFQARP